MSIYLAKKQLIEILDRSNLDYKMNKNFSNKIAIQKDKVLLDKKTYSEENLRNLVKSKKNLIVDPEFWNYEYCTHKNISQKVTKLFLQNLDVVVDSEQKFSEGNLIALIILNEMLLNTFKIRDKETYITYLSGLKINKKIIRNFLLGIEYKLPLTENYLILILEVFDNDTIYDFLFKECCDFNLEEFIRIMSFFDIDDLNLVSYYIITSFKDKTKVLEYFGRCIDLYEDKIDVHERVTFTKKNKNPYLGYYLMTMVLNKDLEEIYYNTVEKYINKGGCINIKISDNEKENNFVQNRKQEIESYFIKY